MEAALPLTTFTRSVAMCPNRHIIHHNAHVFLGFSPALIYFSRASRGEFPCAIPTGIIIKKAHNSWVSRTIPVPKMVEIANLPC
jgi:hypothetical protein